MSKGTLPKDWTSANVVPVHKKGDRHIAGNYRPISLTSVVVKIMERIICKRIIAALEQSGCLSDTQFGFRDHRSTVSLLLSAVHDCICRPVSITSIFSKFMESIIKDHLMNHLLTNNLLSAYQFGFVPGRSCTTQLLQVLDYLTKHLDNGESVDVIYLDYQKAFDSVPHQHLAN